MSAAPTPTMIDKENIISPNLRKAKKHTYM
jgi:hypothetical protein